MVFNINGAVVMICAEKCPNMDAVEFSENLARIFYDASEFYKNEDLPTLAAEAKGMADTIFKTLEEGGFIEPLK